MEIIFFLIAVIAFVIFIVKKVKSDNKRYEEWRQKQEKEQESKTEKETEKIHQDITSNQEKENIEQNFNADVQPDLPEKIVPVAKIKDEIKDIENRNKTITFPVVGLNYEGRSQKLTRIINQYKREDYFYPLYDGYTNKEIKEEVFGDIYEVSGGLDNVSIQKEDDNQFDPNALKVIVKDLNEKNHHIGYVPKEHCVEIRELLENHDLEVSSSIYGGKYKTVEYDYDDDFNEKEKVVVESTPYGLEVDLTFIPK